MASHSDLQSTIEPHYPHYDSTVCDFCKSECDLNWTEIDINLGWQYCHGFQCKDIFERTKSKFIMNVDTLKSTLGANFAVLDNDGNKSNRAWQIMRCIRPKETSKFIVHLASLDSYLIHQKMTAPSSACQRKISPLSQELVKINKCIPLNDLLYYNKVNLVL